MKVKGIFPKAIYGILSVLVCVSFSGCSIGAYHVADVYTEGNGEQRFMGFGKTGPSGGAEDIKSANSTDEINDIQENNYNSESIVGTELKRGFGTGKRSYNSL